MQINTHITELEFTGSFFFYNPIKTLAQSSCLQNLKKLVLPSSTDLEDVKALAQSPYLQNLRELYLIDTTIYAEDLKALFEYSNLYNLAKLSIDNWNIDCKTIEAIAELQDPRIELNGLNSNLYRIFYCFLLRKAYFNDQTMDEKDIKEMVMDLAQHDYDGKFIEHILENPDKYPFLINSKDEQGHTLFHFYTHSPKMQKFLFKRGIIPEEERNQRGDTVLLVNKKIIKISQVAS